MSATTNAADQCRRLPKAGVNGVAVCFAVDTGAACVALMGSGATLRGSCRAALSSPDSLCEVSDFPPFRGAGEAARDVLVACAVGAMPRERKRERERERERETGDGSLLFRR